MGTEGHAAILTVSDRCTRGQAPDESGPALREVLRARLGLPVSHVDCVEDDAPTIAAVLTRWASLDNPPNLILTTGGTGLGPRDVTPEATLQVIERRHPALLELARLRCLEATPRAFLSRGECGVARRTLIINLPGSPRGATEMLRAIADLLPHALGVLGGEDHPPRPKGSA